MKEKFFASEMGRSHMERYPYEAVTAIYAVMEEIAREEQVYRQGEYPADRFDFTKEIEELSKQL